MSMNRNQITLCAIGGVFAVGALALGWFLYSAMEASDTAKTEYVERLEKINALKGKATDEALAAVKANANAYIGWRDNAGELAGRGDRKFGATTAPSFKQLLQSERARLAALPGGANGKIAADGFLFGFDKYLGQNQTMPEDADLPKLQRQLDSISALVTLLSESKVDEVKAIKRDESPAAPAEAEAPASGKNAKKGAEEPAVASLDYSVKFLASPGALVEVMNRLNADLRFMVVTGFSFTESADLIAAKFAEREQAAAAAAKGDTNRSSRRRRRGAAAAEEAAQAAAQEQTAAAGPSAADRLVIAPEIDAPLEVDLTIRVYDFGKGVAVTVAPEPKAEAEQEAAEPAAEAKDDAAEAKPAAGKAEEPAAGKPAEPAAEEEATFGDAKEETAK